MKYIYACGTVTPRWYQEGAEIYDLRGRLALYVDGEQVHSAADGRALYWIDGQHLFEHGTGLARFFVEE